MVVISRGKLISSQAFSHDIFPHKSITNFLPIICSSQTPPLLNSVTAFLAVPKQILHFPVDALSAQTLPLRALLLVAAVANLCVGGQMFLHCAGHLGHAAPTDLEHVGNLL